MTIVKNGRSEYRIVVADNVSPSTKHGAEELQTFLKKITGVQLPIVSDSEPISQHEIILGDNAHLKQLGIEIDFPALGDEGYVIRTIGSHIVIAGGSLRGNLYGVYGLLEDHLGCRWFTPTVSTIPRHETLVIPPIDDRQIPVLEYREPFVLDCFDGDWCARNRVNSNASALEEEHGGKVSYYGFVHTFNRLIPPDKYFDEHPEYFSLVNGERLRERSQLCCTNEEVIQLIIESIRGWMREHPEASVFSVSQNDWANYCECHECQALAEDEQSQMAPVLSLVNRVAQAVKDEFPGKSIDTLAYQWTRKPPKTLRPLPNVIVRLCSIECCFSHPFDVCDSEQNRRFRTDTEAWAKVCNRLWVWNYNTSFTHYLCPFPNLRVRGPNIRFFAKNNVKGIFEQGVYNTLHGELSSLSGYLGAKLLWNPDYDEDKAIDEFLEGVYGKASQPIREYLDMIHDKVERDNIHINIWIGPDAEFLTEKILEKSDALWQSAEDAVADDPEILERVRIARLSPDYVLIERRLGKKHAPGESESKSDSDQNPPEISPQLSKRIDRFFAVAERNGVARLSEWSMPLKEYREQINERLQG